MPSEVVLLFAGQGSRTTFSEASSETLLNRISHHHIAALVLEACYDAFVQDSSTLSDNEKQIVTEDDLNSITAPEDLVKPTVALAENPVVQATTLYLHQILEYILYAGSTDSGGPPGTLSETTGFCSGILPALVVAANATVESTQFFKYAVGAFRVAFWTAIRSALFSKTLGGPTWRSLPWSLVVAGLSRSELETFLRDTHSQTPHHVRISAFLGDNLFSLSGTGTELDRLRGLLPKETTCRPAFIHTCYHGGADMEKVLQNIVQDVQRLKISFPEWNSLQVSIRSTFDGKLFNPGQSKSKSPLDVALCCMLIHPVRWNLTLENLIESATQRLEANHNLHSRILALGPNAGSLLPSGKGATAHHRLKVEHTPSKRSDTVTTNSWSESDIAIVGMSVDIPGSESLHDFWEMLQNSTSVATEIPSSRFNLFDYYDKDAGDKPKPRRMPTKHGNFLNHPFHFDNAFFSISPREAKSMDPQQRLILQSALKALEDAGYAPNTSASFQPDKMGVFIGAATGDYVDNARNNIDVYYSPGTLRAFLSGRISYAFGFKGPSIVIDTACSSSIVAIHQACMALKNGDCVSALAGGVNVISSPDMYLGLSRAHFLSPTGQCKPFDAAADGYCRAESSAVFVLKRMTDAITSGDQIYGVIRGSSINQSGTSKSITHPDADTQALLFRDVLARSKVPAQTISVVEAHGTGTQAGDFCEVSSLQAVFGQGSGRRHPLLLSSIKGNIGHAEAASGSIGLAKLLLMMQKSQIPPQASFQRLNPRLSSIADHNIIIPTQLQDWKVPYDSPRRALLNNFGAAGSNAALILEEYRGTSLASSAPPRSAHVLNISARTSKALEELRLRYVALLRKGYHQASFSISDLCYSANARRQQHNEFRISVVGNSKEGLAQKLEQASVTDKLNKRAQDVTVFLFSGQANLYRGMGAELLSTAPVFHEAVSQCDEILRRHGFEAVEDFLANKDPVRIGLVVDEEVVAQCACFVLQYALAKLWQSWGVAPHLVVGHSIGEYAAFVLAGTLSVDEAILLIAQRAKLMVSHCVRESSGMVACKASTTNARAELSQLFGESERLVIACDNGPEDCVVAGDLNDLETFLGHCKAVGIKAIRLQVPFGFHSPAMEPIIKEFRQVCSNIRMKPGRVPIGSSHLGKIIRPEDLTSDYLTSQTRHVVKFSEVIRNLVSSTEGKRFTFLEIGHTSGMTAMVKTTLKGTNAVYASSLRPTESPWTTISTTLKTFFLEGTPVKWSEVYTRSGAKYLISTPRYPLSPSEFVIPFQETSLNEALHSSPDLYPASKLFFQLAKRNHFGRAGATFEARLSLLSEFMAAHIVGGTPLCPASVYIELALEALDQCRPISEGTTYVLRDISFESPLVPSSNQDDNGKLDVSLDYEDSVRGGPKYFFKAESVAGGSHCKSVAVVEPALSIKTLLRRKTAFIKKHVDSMLDMSEASGDTFSSRMIYDVVFPRVVSYTGRFLTLERLSVNSSGLEGHGIFRLPAASPTEKFICDPALVDTLLHTAGFIANNWTSQNQACICVKVETITLLHEEIAASIHENLSVYCNMVDCVDGFIIGDAYALNRSGEVIAMVEGMHFKKTGLKAFQGYLARLHQGVQHQTGQNSAATERVASKNTVVPMESTHDTNMQRRQTPDMLGVLHHEVRRICETDVAIDADVDLAQLGIDSLLFIELTQALRHKLPMINSSDLDLTHCSTLREMESLLLSRAQSSPSYDVVARMNGTFSATEDKAQPYVTRPIQSAIMPAQVSSLGIIKTLVQDICGFDIFDVDKDTALMSLGVDSLLSIELEQGLRQLAGITVDRNEGIISELTVGQLERLILEKLSQSQSPVTPQSPPSPATTSSATKLQVGNGSRHRVYLFHDGSGLSQQYAKIGRLGCELYGVSSLDFSSIDPTIQDLGGFASQYISMLRLADHAQDTILGGWSFGGVLASEIARQLHSLGCPAKGLILLDSPCPIGHEPLPDVVIKYIAGTASDTQTGIRSCIEAQFKRNAGLLLQYKPPLDSFSIPTVMLLCRETFDAAALCGLKYAWLDNREFREGTAREWERVVGEIVQVLEVEGNHFDMFATKHLNTLTHKLVASYNLLA